MVHEVQLPRSARSSDRSRFDRSGGGEGKTINAAPQVDTKGSCVVAVDTKGLLCRGWWWTKGVCYCWLGTRRRWGRRQSSGGGGGQKEFTGVQGGGKETSSVHGGGGEKESATAGGESAWKVTVMVQPEMKRLASGVVLWFGSA